MRQSPDLRAGNVSKASTSGGRADRIVDTSERGIKSAIRKSERAARSSRPRSIAVPSVARINATQPSGAEATYSTSAPGTKSSDTFAGASAAEIASDSCGSNPIASTANPSSAARGRAGAGSSIRTGKRSQNTEPEPGIERTPTVPPISSA
ncbi:MAG: hypothetical protein ACOVQI_14010, partial [Tagaea sp.]